MKYTTTLITTLAIAASGAMAQDLERSAPAQDHPIFLVGATVHTVSGETIENGLVSFTDGIIGIVGKADEILPRISLGPDTEIIDLSGKHLYPGLIDSVTVLGLEEVSSVRATLDQNETGDMTPEVRAYVAVNPDSTVIPTARANGILTFGVFPTGGTIPGRASILKADGWTTEDLAIERDAGVIINWPRMRFEGENARRQRERRDERITALTQVFADAKSYVEKHSVRDLRLEAIATVLPGAENQNQVFINADDYDQITAGVNWATDNGLRPVIVGGRDAHLCTDLLASTNTPVIIGGTYNFPKRNDGAYDEAYTLPAKLEAAGVQWSLTMSGRFAHERNLPEAMGISVAHGLDHDAALRGITLKAAQILGIDGTLGSIEPGKHATLIVSDGDILDVTSIVEHAWIQGRTVELTNKQTELRDKYREKYRQLDMIEGDD
ncbi:MAG: amidohydrolase family protein [Phycisphaerales bacterium]|nr:amidohydrolase family protein [Phycisphaerales bacterium]